MLLPAITALLYTLLTDPVLAVPLILVEATGFAMLTPALYSVVAANAPAGRSSTAQGLFGAAGTTGFIFASLASGVLAERSIVYPFYLCSAVMIAALVVGVAIGRDRLRTGRGGIARTPRPVTLDEPAI
jgi:MFS family permease